MKRFWIGLLCPALRAINNYIDKYLLSKIFHEERNLSVLLIFSSIIGIVALLIIRFFVGNVFAISTLDKLVVMGGGILYILSLVPYLYAMRKDDTSTVVPLFQMIAPISLILGYFFLGESLSIKQLLGFIIVFASSVLLSLDITHKIKFKHQVFLWMLLSCVLTSFMYITFKRVHIETPFWTTMFWQYVGFGIVSLVLLCIPGYSKSFLNLFKVNKFKIISLNAINEGINVIAIIIMNYISILTFIGLAQLINGFQPMFVFIYGVILTLLFPKIIKEDISKVIVIQKIICFLLMLFGLYLL